MQCIHGAVDRRRRWSVRDRREDLRLWPAGCRAGLL